MRPSHSERLTVYLLGLQDDSGTAGGISSTSASVNRYILQLAQEYCGDCKNSFDELSKIIQVEEWERLYCVLLSASRIDEKQSCRCHPVAQLLGLPLPSPAVPLPTPQSFSPTAVQVLGREPISFQKTENNGDYYRSVFLSHPQPIF